MPRVAHVLRKYDPSQWGGTETHVVEVCRRLGEHGWDAEVHAPRPPDEPVPDTVLPAGVPLRRFHAFAPFVGDAGQRAGLWQNAGNLASLDEPWRLWRDRGLALAHLHTAGRLGGAVRTAMRLSGRPYLISVHGPRHAEPAMVRDDTARRLRGLVDLGAPIGALLGARRVFHDAARVICFNDDEHAALRELVGERARRMDHGVDRGRLGGGDAARARRRWPVLGDDRVVLLLGRLAAQKNQRLAVRAFARAGVPGTRLVLAGAETDPGYRALVEADARAAGVAERVSVLGNVAPGEVPDLLAAAELIVVPSTHEAFGLAVLEGWAAARPVLFAACSGMADLARAYGAAAPAIASLDEATWAGALAARLADPALAGGEARAGAALVARRFDWTLIVKQLAGIYDEVLVEEAGRRRRAG